MIYPYSGDERVDVPVRKIVDRYGSYKNMLIKNEEKRKGVFDQMIEYYHSFDNLRDGYKTEENIYFPFDRQEFIQRSILLDLEINFTDSLKEKEIKIYPLTSGVFSQVYRECYIEFIGHKLGVNNKIVEFPQWHCKIPYFSSAKSSTYAHGRGLDPVEARNNAYKSIYGFEMVNKEAIWNLFVHGASFNARIGYFNLFELMQATPFLNEFKTISDVVYKPKCIHEIEMVDDKIGKCKICGWFDGFIDIP